MSDILIRDRYDVVVAGARVAGAATAMLLARAGMTVLVVDPARRGSDTLSTHALMRAGVLQLHRWGVLDRIRSAGTPRIRTTTFHYDTERIDVDIKPRDGVDGLYAPRRKLIDEILVTAAEEAGAHVVHGVSLEGLSRDGAGRVTGASVALRDRTVRHVDTSLVIGADGRSSRVAGLVGAEVLHVAFHSTANIFGHWPDLDLEGYHWHFHPGFGTGAIPTNDGETCVFTGLSPEVFHAERHRGLEAIYHEALETASPELAERVRATGARVRLRAFAGAPGVLRRAAGPGWALVGDAGYYRDPITAHGITDALRDAELLARAVVHGTDAAYAEYGATRDRLSERLIDVTDRLASLEWSLDEAKKLHIRLSREMSAEAEYVASLGPLAGAGSTPSSPLLRTA